MSRVEQQQFTWRKRGIIYQLSGTQDWRHSHVQLPIVDTDDSARWRIYYSSRDTQGCSLPSYFDVEPGRPDNIIYDHVEPVLHLGHAGQFDQHGVMPTAIASVGDQKYLYYIGWSRQISVPYQNAIGLAIASSNSEKFEKVSTEPIIGTNAIDPIYVGTLGVLREGNMWHGYYMSCTEWRDCGGRLEPVYLLKYAHSEDGIHWQRNGDVIFDFQHADEGGIVAASVYRNGGKDTPGYWMWFCHRKDRDFRDNKKNSYRIGFASSNDARHWQRQDEYVGIDVSESGWDSEMICYPNVVRHGNRLYMFYNGNGFGQSGIGYATLDLQGC